ncbi:MAG: hypothetical protein NDI69_03710 [Bacteriovoracaceae bacterium]|nr:hypothetical protein [Bacteriovoracaceae bacterium]
MEEVNNQATAFKKIDREIFERLDKFKLTPSYGNIQDFYNSMEEEQQRLFKGGVILALFLVPALLLAFLAWQNNSLKEDLNTRISLISKANEIIGQKQGIKRVSPGVLSDNPIDGASMMSSRLSNLLSSVGMDLSKIKVSNYGNEMISDTIMRAEADFAFNNVSTDELMNIFTSMITREKFRIQSVNIKRNADSNLLQGQFHAIHFSNAAEVEFE